MGKPGHEAPSWRTPGGTHPAVPRHAVPEVRSLNLETSFPDRTPILVRGGVDPGRPPHQASPGGHLAKVGAQLTRCRSHQHVSSNPVFGDVGVRPSPLTRPALALPGHPHADPPSPPHRVLHPAGRVVPGDEKVAFRRDPVPRDRAPLDVAQLAQLDSEFGVGRVLPLKGSQER